MTPTITVVIEVHETPSSSVHAISGRSGRTYGHATYDQKRGCMCFRMTLEEWREAKEDLCLSRHRFYPLKWDVEVEDVAAEAAETDEKPKRIKRTKK